MHVHGSHGIQFAALVPTQATQQATAAKRSAAEVRKKLSAAAADSVAHIDAYTRGEHGRQQRSPDEDTFRNLLVSLYKCVHL